jgi:hypothetical protein
LQLPSDAKPGEVSSATQDIRRGIRNRGMRGRGGPIHDVVLVYFAGEDLIDDTGTSW